jgi:hypothetical protein
MVYHASSDYSPQKLKALHIHKGKTLNFIICTKPGNTCKQVTVITGTNNNNLYSVPGDNIC